jgi:surface protein
MTQMFYGCTGFNQPIGSWDLSNVTTIQDMFRYANVFDQDIGAWDVSNVTTMYALFYPGPSLFNNGGSSSIGNWNTSKVTNIDYMLYNADAFDQDLSNWIVTGLTSSASNFMRNANGLSTTNYDRTLSGWSSQLLNNSISINFGGSQYSTATGLAYRNALVASGWTITDGGAV